MKKTIFIILILFAIITQIGTAESKYNLVGLISEKLGITSNNLLKNNKFEDGFKSWKIDGNVILINTNKINMAYIESRGKERPGLSQNVNVISGSTYRLTFQLSGMEEGFYVILRDVKTGKECYKWCTGNNNNKLYNFDIISQFSGKHQLHFKSMNAGKYFLSNIEFRKFTYSFYLTYYILSFVALTSALFILLRSQALQKTSAIISSFESKFLLNDFIDKNIIKLFNIFLILSITLFILFTFTIRILNLFNYL